VSVELRYGDDFVLLRAPPEDRIRLEDPHFERPDLQSWLRVGPARASARLVPTASGAQPILMIVPAAATQLEEARVSVRVELDRTPIVPTLVTARLSGRENCETAIEAHHDSVGPDTPGAADAAGISILLEA